MPGATQPRSDLGRATISAAPARSSHTRPSVWRALTAAAAGWGCGSACPAAGWPAPTTPLTSTPRRTIKRPTIPWPSRWSMTIASAGVTSISGPSDTPGPPEPPESPPGALRGARPKGRPAWSRSAESCARRERPRACVEDRVRAGSIGFRSRSSRAASPQVNARAAGRRRRPRGVDWR